jgi:hypothetical protein
MTSIQLRKSYNYGKLEGKEGMKDGDLQTDEGGAVILHKLVLLTLTLCLATRVLGSEPYFVVTMRFEGNENRTQEFFDGHSQSQGPTARLWQGQDVFSTSLAANATGGLKKSTARLEGTFTVVRIRWTGDAQTPPPEVTKWVIGWRQWASLSAGSSVQYNNTNVSTASVSGETPPGTYTDSVSHSGYGSSTGGRPQNEPWVGREFFEVSRSQFTWNPAGWWETGENLLSRTIKMDVSAQITVPHGYNTANATLYLQAVVANKFVTIAPDTYEKGADSQGNPVPVLNSPDEGDTAVRLSFNPLLLRYEWTTDITHQLDFKPSFEAWHPSYYYPGMGAPPFLTNPDILWSAVGAHNVDINDAWPTSARVMQNYGAYIPYNMPSLSNYSLRVRATDNTDGFTDVAEKRMRVHFPIEEWQQLGLEEHPIVEWVQSGNPYRPCPTKLALGIIPPNDWDLLTVVTGPATFQRTDNWQTSLTVTGAIQLQPGVTLGSDVVKLAFQVNAGVTLGTTYTRASGTTYTWTVPAGQTWKFYWGFAHLCLWGLCDIYDQAGYAGTCRWDLLKWQSDPSGAVPIVYTYRVEP